ncbi:glycoside hydrolase family 3 N-terminal domain-containing protein [Pedobacter borealis]|uniref:glycoside hydrolase family 3 N-terminal domain-containing protein n=1 Tax=Pedobacter borealis TaxID=475254 RepID=UPI0004933242|nr:glycoside hydrolase family 3 N-terminal domain-containing protein [Pedobacter borealis]
MLTKYFLLILFFVPAFCFAQQLPYQNVALDLNKRVEDLLSRMTLDEKLAQMQHIHSNDFDTDKKPDMGMLINFSKGISYGCIEGLPYSAEQYAKLIFDAQKYMREETRLGIPLIPVMEGLHGAVQDGSTIYPQSIALAATFNPGFAYKMTSLIGVEARAIGIKQVLAPDLDLARELRWGRVEETFGEDPYLVSQMGIAYIKGFHEHRIITTPKHFVAHGSPSGGLNLASVAGGMNSLYNLYMVPFEKVIKETAPFSIMNCYSSYDGEPVTGSSFFLTDLLRNTLKFKGYVYSDWGSVEMLYNFHKTAIDQKDAAAQAVKAGLDLEASGRLYSKLAPMVNNATFDISYIDSAVSRILYVKFASGLFDEKPVYDASFKKYIHSKESQLLAKQIADESVVLLKNQDNLLPLDIRSLKSIAVIGPNADQVQFGDYTWSRNNKDGISPLIGIRNLTNGKLKVNYAKGCDLTTTDTTGFKEAVQMAAQSDVAVVFVGSQSASLARDYSNSTSGEGFDLSDLTLPGAQEELIKGIKATGKPVIVVLVTGRPFVMSWEKENVPAILTQWYAGEQEGASIADVLFGNVVPSGKLPVSFPQSSGNLPVFYNYLPTDKGFYKKSGSSAHPGRDYVFSSPGSLWPFGFGLSYTSFQFGDLKVSSDKFAVNDTIKVSANISNTGKLDAMEVAQLYVRDQVSSIATPVKQLRGFQKVLVKAGGTTTVHFSLPVSELAFYNKKGVKTVEPGLFDLMIGSSSQDIHLTKTIAVSNGSESVKAALKPVISNVTDPVVYKKRSSAKVFVIQGIIRDVQASGLSGVKVSVKGKSGKVVSGKGGEYEIKAREGDTLIFVAPGHDPYEVEIHQGGYLNITLSHQQ